MSADQTLDIVVRALAAQANVPATGIDTDKPLSAVPGIESVKALRAITDIEDECDVVIPDDFLFETATVRELAEFVSSLIPEGSSI
ncbi:acyl carrier protein [Streptomyces sp. NBC_01408]|uniref:acyl carrier protein n=1 Tax=Streptomyces sp. NBC_01408 TaxID=2903855 RepID=UPI00224F36F5|nr:acyl carrier protein [Streptomyces sp. NBC_01408]MCX4695806.1 acyl carrier protein [Streptomyces sp. NBC_01408]